MSQRRISRTLKRTFVDHDPASIPERTVGVIQTSSVSINRDSNLSARFMTAFFDGKNSGRSDFISVRKSFSVSLSLDESATMRSTLIFMPANWHESAS